MAKELKIDGRMKVKTLKSQFKAAFGASLRVYNGKKFADEDAEGHGICMKDKAVYRCSDLCHIILRKL